MMTVLEIAAAVAEGKKTALEVTQESLAKIAELNPRLNALVEVFEADALAQAKAVDAKRARGEKLGPLCGVPVAIKDNILYKGHHATCCSKMLANYVASYTSTVVEKLLAADAVIIGRANMDEFAMGSTNQTSVYGPVKNPVDETRVPGGSSGGSAAAVASGMVPVALGTDTGGSVRQPAGFCGIVGIKPGYGRISRYGVIAFSSSADQVGVLARTVADSARVLEVLAGKDVHDSTSLDAPVPAYEKLFTADLKGLKVGLPKGFLDDLSPDIKARLDAAAQRLQELGAELVEVEVPHAKYAAPCYYIITSAEASSNLGRYDGIRYGYADNAAQDLNAYYEGSRDKFGLEVKKRLIIGTYALTSKNYEECFLKAMKVRELIRQDFKKVFTQVDLLLTPTSPTTAFKLGEHDENPLSLYLADLYTCQGNIGGLAGISVPFGKDKQGLPVGVQFYGPILQEEKILNAAYNLEKGL
ncbi:MAG: Asp-tRNA(Asn)/Glu-tRNA(Gln) amidotransferase subunit GatA [Elusimicrobia bacterium]|nr:Asp-tRNA(Asn)/Glu-tRNA(Gln) amidotransferase subunit GatA [Elusimicrobiota bacterium]MDD7502566.1 Asp-tRNA(Asn)/Glu-tRNA(Gln) amidotransferase subunit GatA [Elusimicrobiota bacterium]MDY5729034.1 Asp-tRNA(Asn)/Glu-tRNA(Gln) amidotransferase subunit GatA [Elusimicrobiaceae bacterium]